VTDAQASRAFIIARRMSSGVCVERNSPKRTAMALARSWPAKSEETVSA